MPTTNWAGNVTFGAARTHRPASVDELRRIVAHLYDVQPMSSIVFDVRDMTFIDAAGVSVLVYALRRSRERGGVVRVGHSRPVVQRVLDITGLSSIMPTALAPV